MCLIKLEFCNLAIIVTHTCNLGGFSSFFVLTLSFKNCAALVALPLMLQRLLLAPTPTRVSRRAELTEVGRTGRCCFSGISAVNATTGRSQRKSSLLLPASQALSPVRAPVWTAASGSRHLLVPRVPSGSQSMPEHPHATPDPSSFMPVSTDGLILLSVAHIFPFICMS